MSRLISLVGKVVSKPHVALREGRCLLKGVVFKSWCRLTRKRFTAGSNFRLEGRIILKGPGAVVIGNNVRIGMTVTPWTYSKDARIEIGSDSYVNGTSFGCQQLIQIGPRAILGRSSIMDTNFHSLSEDRHLPKAEVRIRPVVLEENVWVGANAGLLPGTRIGRNSVIGFGAVCSGEYPANVIIAGNPAKIVRELEAKEPFETGPLQ